MSRMLHELLERFDAGLSRRFPIPWRTRTPLALVIGATLSVFAYVSAVSIDIDRVSIPGLDSSLLVISIVSFTFLGGAALFAADQVRRIGALFSASQIVRGALCVAISSFVLLLSPYVFLQTVMPRVAALESADMVAFHREHDYWRCYPYSTFAQGRPTTLTLDETTLSRLLRDLERHALPPMSVDGQVGFITDGTCASGGLSLYVPVIGGTRLLERFEQRLRNIEAAAALGHSQGPYRSTWLSHVVDLLVISTATGLFALTALWFWPGRSQFTERLKIPLAIPGKNHLRRLDERLAARVPLIWSTQLHASVGELGLGAAIALAALYAVDGPYGTFALAVLVALPWLLVRRQRYLRSSGIRMDWEVAVFCLQTSLIFLLAVLLGLWAGFANWQDLSRGEVGVAMAWYALAVGAWLQAARSLSPLQAALGSCLAPAWLLLCTSIAGDMFSAGLGRFGWIAVWCLLLSLAAWYVDRLERWPAVASVLAAGALPLTPGIGGYLILALLESRVDLSPLVLNASIVFMSVLSSLGGIRATLARRVKAAYAR